MTNVIQIHPESPQERSVSAVVDVLEKRGVIAFPTDSGYALGCIIAEKEPLDRIRQIRKLEKNHLFTLMCPDLSTISEYARVDNPCYRLLKANTPGSYTYILQATKSVPRLLKHPKRKTIGIRVPDNNIVLSLLLALGAPLLSVSLVMPDEDLPPADIDEVEELLKSRADLLIDGGDCIVEPTSVIDLTGAEPKVLREGRGDTEPFIW